MIIGENRKAVIENIKKFAENGEFHNKVELNDPVLTAEQNREITDSYIENRKNISFKIKTMLGVSLAKIATKIINKDTEIKGLEKIPENSGGVLITSNHFGPLENTVIRHLTNTLHRPQLGIIRIYSRMVSEYKKQHNNCCQYHENSKYNTTAFTV